MLPVLDAFFCTVIVPSPDFGDMFEYWGNICFTPLHKLLEHSGKNIHTFRFPAPPDQNPHFRRHFQECNTLPRWGTCEKLEVIYYFSKCIFLLFRGIVRLPMRAYYNTRISIVEIRSFLHNSENEAKKIQKIADFLDRSTIFKITCVFLNIICAIPGTFIGTVCKIIGLLFSREHATEYSNMQKYKILIRHIKCKKSIRNFKKEVLIKMGTSGRELPFAITTNSIFPLLDIETLHEIRILSKNFYAQIAEGRISADHMKCFHGLPFTCSYLTAYLYMKKFKNDIYMDKVIEMLGGVEKYFQIPLKTYNMVRDIIYPDHMTDNYLRHINILIKDENSSTLPPIQKLRFSESDGHYEYLLIKYTLFIPREHSKEENDRVEYHYLIMGSIGSQHVAIRDSQLEFYTQKGVDDHHSILHRPGEEPTTIIPNDEEFLIKLLKNKPVGIFRSRTGNYRPDYVYKKWNSFGLPTSDVPASSSYSGKIFEIHRLFEDIPILLGHVSLETMLAQFIEKELIDEEEENLFIEEGDENPPYRIIQALKS